MKISGVKRIAERYVRALFDVAEAAGALGEVEKDLASLRLALAESDAFRDFLTNPLLSREAQAEAMETVLAKMKAGQVTKQFISMLARHRRLPALPDIAELFARWAAGARGEMTAEVIAAAPLKAKDTKAISDQLGKTYGKKITLDVREDADLLGGMVIKIGSQQLDGSLAGKLARLHQILRAA